MVASKGLLFVLVVDFCEALEPAKEFLRLLIVLGAGRKP